MNDLSTSTEPLYGVLNSAGFIPARRVLEYCLSVDLGSAMDPTAIALIEHRRDPIPAPEGIGSDLIQKLTDSVYVVRHLSRVPLHTSYVRIAGIVSEMAARPEIRGKVELVIDKTGVGNAVADIFTQCGLCFSGITITAGDSFSQDGAGGYRVSKLALVSRLQAEFHAKTLRIPKDLPEAAALVNELQQFRATISEAGRSSFGARSGQHDDMVLALAMGLWFLKDRCGSWSNEELIF